MINDFNEGRILSNFPPVLPIGPVEPYEHEEGQQLKWLDDQPTASVLYVSFGSRTAISKDQIRELGNGLKNSSHKFLWVIKTSKVDKDDEDNLEELLGTSFLEKTKNKGIIVKGWVSQEQILKHSAIGGFLSHCGWNSVTEAARHGVTMLAWPQHGDQKINAEVVERAGWGVWPRDWGWGGENLIKGEDIQEKILEVMGDETLRSKAKKVGEQAKEAIRKGSTSQKLLSLVIESLKQE